jgi:hypothetical protein
VSRRAEIGDWGVSHAGIRERSKRTTDFSNRGTNEA